MYTSNNPGTIPCVCTTIKKLSRVLVKTYDSALAGTDINITQLAILRCIDRRTGEPLSHVAAELEMDRTSLYRAVTPMERDGWVQIGEGKDARSRTASVTNIGRAVLKKAQVRWDKVQQQVIGGFGEAQWVGLVAAVNRLADCAEQEST